MSSPSSLGDLGHQIAVIPAATATAAFIDQQTAADTGTIVASGRAIDLANPLKSTTGSFLDATRNPTSKTPKQYRSVGIALPLELRFDASGRYAFFSVAHQHRSATSGAGSTWATLKTEVFDFRNGTSTQGIFHTGVVSTVVAQAIKRYYKAVVTLTRKLTTSTAAKDTTTGSQQVCVQPSYILAGADLFPAQDQ
jgi:hypothetical protein